MFAFVHIRKTAGSTIESILRASFGLRHCGVRVNDRRSQDPLLTGPEIARLRWLYPRLQSISGHGVNVCSNLRETFPQIRFYTFLREPLARCASDYQFRVFRGGLRLPFEKWIETSPARNRQTQQIGGCEDAQSAINALDSEFGFVGLVEAFSQSLVLFRRWCGESRLDLRHRPKNVATNSSIRDGLLQDFDSRRRLIEANREDLKLYSHVNEHIFPRQVAQYGPRLKNDLQTFEAFNLPRSTYPRELPSLLLREAIYKPLAAWICDRQNPPRIGWSPAAQGQIAKRAA